MKTKQNNKHMNDVIDLEQEIVGHNTATLHREEQAIDAQRRLDFEIAKVEAKIAEAYRAGVMNELGFDYETAEARRIRKERQDFAALPQNRIMSTEAIRAVCLKYGLRFLPTRFYKGSLDAGIGPAVEKTKTLLGGKLPSGNELIGGYDSGQATERPSFAIAAPSSAFALQPKPQDPLLFLRLNSLKWFLVHKWGDDLRTSDIRKGEITESNWNSQFSDERSRGVTIQGWNGANLTNMIVGTTSSMGSWVTSNSQNVSSGITWAQNIGNQWIGTATSGQTFIR